MKFTDKKNENRFELTLANGVALADYRLQDKQLIIDRVFVPDSLRGQGVAAKLMEAVVAEAKKRGLSIVPVCSYAASYMQRHAQKE